MGAFTHISYILCIVWYTVKFKRLHTFLQHTRLRIHCVGEVWEPWRGRIILLTACLSQHWACICISFCFRELQRHRETIIQKLAVQKQQQISNEEEIITKAVAEHEAKQARERRKKEEKHAAVMNSIAAHRESVVNKLVLIYNFWCSGSSKLCLVMNAWLFD